MYSSAVLREIVSVSSALSALTYLFCAGNQHTILLNKNSISDFPHV